MEFSTTFHLPFSGTVLIQERHRETGRLQLITGAGRRYLTATPDGRTCIDGLAEMREWSTEPNAYREVQTASASWRETYRWDACGRLDHVDGASIERDECGRVIGCGPWRYHYVDGSPVRIEGPERVRHLTWDPSRRRLAVHRSGDERVEHRYDAFGNRADDVELPPTHHRDECGRLWEVTDRTGAVIATYLWDRYRCLARIDGPLGTPIAAAFCLDPTATPVRMITADGVIALPRDAFGEGLLAHNGVPGLFGGAIHRGKVHLRHRRLDPRTASFCSSDPFDGGAADPRRSADEEALATETGFGGPYAICRHDPVGRADPSGALSGLTVPLLLSDFTWSLQNNLVSFIGIDWWFNFLGSLFTGFQAGDFASSSGLEASDHIGAFALRRDGVIAAMTGGRAFTTQHIVWAPDSAFSDLARSRVIDPGQTFEPALYGSLLLALPSEADPILLRGSVDLGGASNNDLNVGALLWTRSGGAPRPAAPGASIPVFPSGGFHLDARQDTTGPRSCELIELDIGAGLAPATLAAGTGATALSPGAVPVNSGDEVLLRDSDGDLAIATVTSAGGSAVGNVELSGDISAIDGADVTLLPLDPAVVSSAAHGAAAQVPNGLNAVGGTTDYASGDLVRVTTASADVTVSEVAVLEAQVTLDRPVPATLGAPVQIRRTVSGAALTPTLRAADTLDFATGTPPDVGDFAVLAQPGGANPIPVLVVDAPDATGRQLDADVSALGAVGDLLEWTVRTRGELIGRRFDPPEAAPQITYVPVRAGDAPDGSVVTTALHISSATETVVRLVVGAPVHDAFGLAHAIAGTAPFQVDVRRARTGATAVPVDSIGASAVVTATRPDVVPDPGSGVIQLQSLAGSPPTPSAGASVLSALTVVGTSLSGVVDSSASPTNPRPGQTVLLDPAGEAEPALVRRIRLAVTLDRPLDLDADSIVTVPLVAAGFTYPAERIDDRRVRVRPEVYINATTSSPTDFPRLVPGETVQLDHAGPAATRLYGVGAVDGTTIELLGDAVVPSGATNIRLVKIVPGDPLTGRERNGFDGRPVGPSPSTTIELTVWEPSHFAAGTVIGVVSGGQTLPARVAPADQGITVELAEAPAATGSVDVGLPTVNVTRFSTRFVRDGTGLRLPDIDSTDFAAGDTIFLTPFVATDRRVTGTLGAGTLLTPSEESHEVDRRQSLVDHELVHTTQYAIFGPLWFSFFPLWALELGLELGTDVDMPDYGPFVDATLVADEDSARWNLSRRGSGSLGFAEGDTVQLVRGGQFVTVEVTGVNGDVAEIRSSGPDRPLVGALQARRVTNYHQWINVPFNIMQHTTAGGLMNQVVGSTYGGIIWSISKLVYGLSKLITGPGTGVTAQVADVDGHPRCLLQLDAEARQGLTGATVVIVASGDDKVTRTIRSRPPEGAVLDQAVPFSGTVTVSAYDSHDPGDYFDWQDYYPATIPDLGNPAVIDIVGSVGPDTLELAPLDRVEVRYRDWSNRTDVASVDGNRVELEQPIVVGSDDEVTLRIAKIGERDPMGRADSAGLLELGLDWMKWIFDPYGQLQLQTNPDPGSFLDVLARSGRYLFGTQSWSILPLFGYLFHDRLVLHNDAFGYRAVIEQQASERSGDLYSDLGRLYGQQADAPGFAQKSMVVGDIARYWWWPIGEDDTGVLTGQLGAPGVHLDPSNLRIVPFRTPVTPNAVTNSDATVLDAARAVPDVLATKAVPVVGGDWSASIDTTIPTGLLPSAAAMVPFSPTGERMHGCYVAFSRPGSHRASVIDTIVDSQQNPDGVGRARDLHNRGQAGIFALDFTQQHGLQTLFFDIAVSDVTVTAAGTTIAEGDTVPLVLGQQLTLGVAPNADRVYTATITNAGDNTVVRSTDRLQLTAQSTPGADTVELSRVYRQTVTGYSGGLAAFGFNPGGDVHVPVRRFTVSVADTVPLRSAADPASAVLDPLTPGTPGFVLIPAAIVDALRLTLFDGRPRAATDPEVTVARVAAPAPEAAAFVGPGGAVLRIDVAATPALPAAVPLVFEATVGPAAATIRCNVNLAP